MPEQTSLLFVVKGLDLGGIERIVVDLAVTLHARGIPVEVAVVNDRRSELLSVLAQHGITVHRLGGTDRIGVRAALRLARLARQSRFSVVHIHGPLPAILARLVPGHQPLVTTSHTPLSALRPATRWLWTATARFDAAALAVSSVVAQSLPATITDRVEVMPHGIDTRSVAAAMTRADSNARARSSDFVQVLVVASHREAKNYPNLLRGIRRALDLGASLRVVAIGAGPLLDEHRAIADSLVLTDVVSFRRPTLDVLDVMAASDILVVASDYEGQPLVVLEALALGIPVVATAVGRIPELLTPAVGRIVAPGDPDALGAALAEVALDNSLRRRMSDAARSTTHGWSLEQATDAHLAVYARVSAR